MLKGGEKLLIWLLKFNGAPDLHSKLTRSGLIESSADALRCDSTVL